MSKDQIPKENIRKITFLQEIKTGEAETMAKAIKIIPTTALTIAAMYLTAAYVLEYLVELAITLGITL